VDAVLTRLGAVVRPRIQAYLTVVVLLALALPAGAAARAHGKPARPPGTPVPAGFVGVDAGGPLLNDNVDVGQQLDRMVASGVQSIRVVINWALAQPYPDEASVPADQASNYVDVGGVPTDFAAVDEIVGLAAARGLRVLPTVLFAPGWDAGSNTSGGVPPPADPGPYADFLTALIGRYGPHGTYWQTHPPRQAIRSWQIWNEENISAYWPQPFAKRYAALLRAAHGAIKAADPGAKVVLGALTNRAWKYLGQLYAVHGARKLFDVVAVNGFTSTPGRVITFLQLVRRGLNHLGDTHTPILMTELGWPSATGHPVIHHDWDTTQRGQARKIKALLPLLAAHRRNLQLKGFDYYTWLAPEDQPGNDDFNFAGLLRYQSDGQIVAKPALSAFRAGALAIERCRRPGTLASRCAKRF
jgi:hypothetical protein